MRTIQTLPSPAFIISRVYGFYHSCDVVRNIRSGVSKVEQRNLCGDGQASQKSTKANPEGHEKTCSQSYQSSLESEGKVSFNLTTRSHRYTDLESSLNTAAGLMCRYKERRVSADHQITSDVKRRCIQIYCINSQCCQPTGRRFQDRRDPTAALLPSQRY